MRLGGLRGCPFRGTIFPLKSPMQSPRICSLRAIVGLCDPYDARRVMPPPIRRFTRVAVVQMAYHPATLLGRRSPLEDPLFELGKTDSLMPESGVVPRELESRLRDLRRRIREAYDDQILKRVQVILTTCRTWNVEIIVFPEYSIPWEILGGIVDSAGPLVVVAGTHSVERDARNSGVYQKLGCEQLPGLGTAVCPVLHQGRLLTLQPKLNPAQLEVGSMQPGQTWHPVSLPPSIPGPLGVMICLDFLYREGERHRGLVGPGFEQCRFLAVPSLTPHFTIPEFTSKAWEEAKRYGRPVLYADIASGGGTSVFVDEGDVTDLRLFPERAGYLEPGDEGVIVADIDLGYERPGARHDMNMRSRSNRSPPRLWSTEPIRSAIAMRVSSTLCGRIRPSMSKPSSTSCKQRENCFWTPVPCPVRGCASVGYDGCSGSWNTPPISKIFGSSPGRSCFPRSCCPWLSCGRRGSWRGRRRLRLAPRRTSQWPGGGRVSPAAGRQVP